MRQRKADCEQKRWKRAATGDTKRAANRLRMTTRRVLEWTKMLEGQAGFEIHQTCYYLIAYVTFLQGAA